MSFNLADVFARNRAKYGDLRMEATGRLAEIRVRQSQLDTNLNDVQIRLDSGELSETEVAEFTLRTDALLQEAEELITEAEPLQARADQIAAVRAAIRAETVIPETGADGQSRRFGTGPEVMSRVNPWDDLDGVRQGLVSPPQIRSRAMAAVEQYSKRSDHYALSDAAGEEVTRKLEKLGQKFGTAFARQLLTTGSPEYLTAFDNYLNDPNGYQQRAAMSLTSANGGFLVPFTLDPTIILTNNGSANPYRMNAQIKTTTTNDWNGVTSAGVTAGWTAEGVETSDASPTVGQLKITPQKADAYLFGSYEVLGDSDFASQLPELLADAKDRLEEASFAVGTGTLQPWGIVPRATAFVGPTGTATGPTTASVYSTMAALPARWRGPNARNVWLANLITINALRNLPKFTGATQSLVDDSGPVPTMLGKPLLESTSITGTFANLAKVLVYADMRQYYIVDRVGMSVIYDPFVLGANRRPTGQGAWYAFWRTGADLSTTAAARALQLTT